MTGILDRELGERLSPKQVAERFGLDVEYLRRNYKAFGGLRPTGPRGRILFFENLMIRAIKECAFGIEDHEERSDEMARPGSAGGPDQAETLRHQGRGPGLGSQASRRRLVDPHGVLADPA